MAGERLATTRATAEHTHDGTDTDPGHTGTPITGGAQFELALKFHLCGDNPIYKLSERQRARVLDNLFAKRPRSLRQTSSTTGTTSATCRRCRATTATARDVQEYPGRRSLAHGLAETEGETAVYGTRSSATPDNVASRWATCTSCFGSWVTEDHQLLNTFDDDRGRLRDPIEGAGADQA
jgi:hypothetical protein